MKMLRNKDSNLKIVINFALRLRLISTRNIITFFPYFFPLSNVFGLS